ncbi:alcohol dehydrogenase class IV [Bacillus ectoiniformans]|uniref:iron-containing alcohol dehydrogenase n=1 Tax=Bacillus ectoiniformans TaxID=1494429 RepID=UPI00195D2748|nr:iron-containing alcohol dehydrogenase [Bacillus ectoiniformans]MBM7649496.1 alcohol dehydrogenase class IV [Bacillus ectoiniformans]
MYPVYCRMYQGAFRTASHFMPWRKPHVLEGVDSLKQLPALLKEIGLLHVLIVTDKGITSLGLMDKLLRGLEAEEIHYTIYDQTVPNPTIEHIEEALKLYHASKSKGFIAFGGGSSIDCAKAVGARVARPEKSIPKMKGQLKIRKPIPPLVAIPTTSGTGSEATLAAVVSNPHTQEKYALNDHVLIPHYAVLDPSLTVKLPPHLTSTTGMDALTHAVEAYIGRSNNNETRQYSREAVQLIFSNLYEAFSNGENLTARTHMQKASYLAGLAFTRAYVGYVHAISHTLTGYYSTPHGLANAIVLPYVLKYYGESVHKPLAELADLIGLSQPQDSNAQKANAFIEAVEKLNADMNIPQKVNGLIQADFPLMVERAYKEANPLYPVPKVLSRKDLLTLFHQIKA